MIKSFIITIIFPFRIWVIVYVLQFSCYSIAKTNNSTNNAFKSSIQLTSKRISSKYIRFHKMLPRKQIAALELHPLYITGRISCS